jgi:DNA repair proteins
MAEDRKIGRRQQIRKTFIAGEPGALTDVSLLELLLSYSIPYKDLQPLAQQLIGEFGDISRVLAADFETLCKIKGIKSQTATLLRLVDWIGMQTHVEVSQTRAAEHIPPDQQTFVELYPLVESKVPTKKPTPALGKKKTKRRSYLFTNAVLKEAIEILSRLPDTEDMTEIRQFLNDKLPFSAETT